MNRKSIVKRFPLTGYFVMTFLISWLGSLLVGGLRILRGDPVGPNQLWLMGAAMLAGPCLSGILMTALVDGRNGLRQLFARIRVWRLGVRWYLPLLVFPALILGVSLLLTRLVSPDFQPTFFAIGIVMGLLAGFIEETGWMGFVFPRMKGKNILISSILLGVIHGFWHMLADYLGKFSEMGVYWLPYFAAFVAFVIALRVLIVWVYTHTRSLLLAQLMHASSTGFLAVIVPMSLVPVNWLIFYGAYSVVLWLAALLLWRFGRSMTTGKSQ